MRLNKYIAQAGICSRRAADELTKDGKVIINGAVMKQPGYDVRPGDIVSVNGRVITSSEKTCCYALNKPVGYVCTASDEKNRPTVLSLLADVEARVYPVGRLDYDTSGLLLLTNDGELTNLITSPDSLVKKTYLARIVGKLSLDELWTLRNGIEIELPVRSKDGKTHTRKYKTKPAEVRIITEKGNESLVEILISEGKNRQVRRMFEAAGHKVIALERTAIGEIKLGRTKPGTYRKLTEAELRGLRDQQ